MEKGAVSGAKIITGSFWLAFTGNLISNYMAGNLIYFMNFMNLIYLKYLPYATNRAFLLLIVLLFCQTFFPCFENL
jgi:hypothetical protein